MTNNPFGKLQMPAIGLIVGSVFNACGGFLATLSGIFRYVLHAPQDVEYVPVGNAERIGYFIGTFGAYGIGLLSLVLAPVVFYGALRMMSGKNLRTAKTAAILSILPITCFFPLTIIFGVWSLLVLRKPEIEALFENHARQDDIPPSPPQEW